MPFKVLTLWITASPVEVFDVIDNETYYILVYFSRVMFYINSAINPILYNIMSSKFREGFRRVFYCVNWPLTPRRLRLSTTSNRAQSSTTTGITWFKKDTHDFRKTFFLLLVSYYKLNKTRGWCPKFATGLNIIICIVQKVYEWSSCPFAKMILS